MLNPNTIPKFINELAIPKIFKPKYLLNNSTKKYTPFYNIDVLETETQMLPTGFPKTKVYAYGGIVYNPSSNKDVYHSSTPGPTFIANRNETIYVRWNNLIENPHILPVDFTLHWANPNNLEHQHSDINEDKDYPKFPPGSPLAQYPVPIVTHLHGGETESKYDGFPDSWFTFNGLTGPTYQTNIYKYLNKQRSCTLFYHDHSLGITRLNVYAGLSGAYLIKDSKNYLDNYKTTPFPKGEYDIPLIIQDKSFNDDGSLYFPTEGINPKTHPYWRASFFGNTNVVNGKVWPKLDVSTRPYRFRIVNASNSRFYTFKLSNNTDFIQLASDASYLETPVSLNEITLSPAERADIIIDFSKCFLGEKILLLNVDDASKNDIENTGQIMQFKVVKTNFSPKLKLPCKLNSIPNLYENVSKRILVLNSSKNKYGIESLLLDGQKWSAPISEKLIIGSTQMWEIVNITAGAHPIHIHLTDFQILNRQKFDKTTYSSDWNTINGSSPLKNSTKIIDPSSYLLGNPLLPHLNERAWKDTVICYPGEITRLILPLYPSYINPKYAKPGVNLFPFDPTQSPGYVWHCHILDHEDNEMMRPMIIVNK